MGPIDFTPLVRFAVIGMVLSVVAVIVGGYELVSGIIWLCHHVSFQ